ncbi:MAG TPA: TlpA disulfide reductase family protein [Thermoanaerobaculia bacterium]|nr:TlpA disulfide reductase family protein [Thermoanaerobaculia bacterium]
MRFAFALSVFIAAISVQAKTLEEISQPKSIPRHFSSAKVRLVNVWATWCAPCVAEMKDLTALDATYSDKQLQIIGVSTDDAIPGDRAKRKKRVESFLERKSVLFRNLYYTGPVPGLLEFYSFEGEIPITFVFDRKGRERARYQGPIDRDLVKKQIDKLLAEH